MELQRLAAAPASAERYWKMKSSRVSPTRLGTIVARHDSQMPMFGVGSQQNRLLNAVEFGGMDVTQELRLGKLLIHSRKGSEPPYDGEVWAWSEPELNRIAYVDGKGDLWIARADGKGADRLMRGPVTLPAWSEDGRLIAVTERKDDGARWDISIVRVPERLRQSCGRGRDPHSERRLRTGSMRLALSAGIIVAATAIAAAITAAVTRMSGSAARISKTLLATIRPPA